MIFIIFKNKLHISKGRKKSKWFFQADVSSKKRTNEFYFTTMKPQVDLFSFIFWRKLKTPKRHFEIDWPLHKKNVAFTLISFAVLIWDDCLSFQVPFEKPVQLLLELEAELTRSKCEWTRIWAIKFYPDIWIKLGQPSSTEPALTYNEGRAKNQTWLSTFFDLKNFYNHDNAKEHK